VTVPGRSEVGGGCGSDHCVTCSDEAVPMHVRDVRDDGTAVCDGGVEVMVDLVGPVREGDELLVHAGVALTLLTEDAERPR
jgi:hydrogenase maturation factor